MSVRLEGLAELRDALRRLPADLAADAGTVVLEAAETAARDIRERYPRGATGRLQGRVSVQRGSAGRFGALALLKSAAAHAWLFENGTVLRHTRAGLNRGRMSPGHVFIPVAQQQRLRMIDRLKALVRAQGLVVVDSGG